MWATRPRQTDADREGSIGADSGERIVSETAWYAPLLALAVIVVVYLAVIAAVRQRRLGAVTVFDWEKGLKFREGRFVGVLEPGKHMTWPEPITIERVDMRELSIVAPGQDILTKDNMTLKATIGALYKVSDPLVWKTSTDSPYSRIYEELQRELRARIAARTMDEILADRAALETGLVDALNAGVSRYGVVVTTAYLRDLALAGPAKQAFADLWKAQKDGQAALERARGEQASLRALANAARMLKGNPELMNLRVLAALAGSAGKAAPNVILGGAPGLVPITPDAAGANTAEDPQST